MLSRHYFEKRLQNPLPLKYRSFKFGKKPLKETMVRIFEILDEERPNPYLISIAREIVSRCPRSADDPNFSKCRIIRMYNYVKGNVKSGGIRYEYDPLDIEYVTFPSRMIEYIENDRANSTNKAAGDCDDHAILLAALLLSVGIPARFKVISQDKNSDYHHIYIEAFDQNLNQWIPLDAIYKEFQAGDEVPYVRAKIYEIPMSEQI